MIRLVASLSPLLLPSFLPHPSCPRPTRGPAHPTAGASPPQCTVVPPATPTHARWSGPQFSPTRRSCPSSVPRSGWSCSGGLYHKGCDGSGRSRAGARPGALRLRDPIRLAPVWPRLAAGRPGPGPWEPRVRSRLLPGGAAAGGGCGAPGRRGAVPRLATQGPRGLLTGAAVERAERAQTGGACRWREGGDGGRERAGPEARRLAWAAGLALRLPPLLGGRPRAPHLGRSVASLSASWRLARRGGGGSGLAVSRPRGFAQQPPGLGSAGAGRPPPPPSQGPRAPRAGYSGSGL